MKAKMEKLKVSLVLIGNSEKMIATKRLLSIRSDLFEVMPIQKIDVLDNDGVEDGYLDRKYSKEDLAGKITNQAGSDFTIGILQERFVDGFYMHRLDQRCGIISLYGIQEILEPRNITLDDFIKKSIYEVVGMWVYCGNLESHDVYSLVHRHTKGCVFDLNGDKTDLIYNTIQPELCESCTSKFQSKQIDSKFLPIFKRELGNLKKPPIVRFEEFVRKFPLISIIATALGSISLNLIASLIWRMTMGSGE